MAQSAANYFVAPPVVLKAPKNVAGVETGCVLNYTAHTIFWEEGGSNAPIANFEIWKSQPIGSTYVYGWSVSGDNYSTTAFVYGADGNAKVRACTSSQCSALSTSTYFARINPACEEMIIPPFP
ncbi:hypothetical protein [Microbulbifer magnicolonia]|uniref:hypothetical protein n=1 Tax=Microbulbifer magnicolonia TaxID=3109744 RepID=UPI002B409717|nr:hypothetical protein [Microbulbifer sp. GG15]